MDRAGNVGSTGSNRWIYFELNLMGCPYQQVFPDPPAANSWTFIVYLAADNNLDPYGEDDLDEMMQVGSTDEVNIIVIYDGLDSGDSRYYRVLDGSLDELATPGELNMGNPQDAHRRRRMGGRQLPGRSLRPGALEPRQRLA
jgi:hypothetical protein